VCCSFNVGYGAGNTRRHRATQQAVLSTWRSLIADACHIRHGIEGERSMKRRKRVSVLMRAYRCLGVCAMIGVKVARVFLVVLRYKQNTLLLSVILSWQYYVVSKVCMCVNLCTRVCVRATCICAVCVREGVYVLLMSKRVCVKIFRIGMASTGSSAVLIWELLIHLYIGSSR